MKLIAFRVSMYKGIIDSDWVNVNDLTVLVGKNESGKTSLLKALHKLNPYVKEPYEMTNEWPRGHRDRRDEEHIVCQARFQLSEEEKSKLLEIANTEKIPNIVQASRNYAGQLAINFAEVSHTDTGQSQIDFEEDFFSNQPSTVEIDTILSDLPVVPEHCSEEFKKCAADCLDEAKRLVNEGQSTALRQLAEKHEPLLRRKRSQTYDYSFNYEGWFINRYLEALNQLAGKTPQVRTPLSEARKIIRDHLPTFIYMDEYRAFSGNAHLKDIQSRKKENRLTEADKTFLMILRLSNLDLDRLVQIGQEADREDSRERLRDIRDGALHLTEKISNRILQDKYVVDFRVDNSFFFTTIKGDNDSAPVELEERSKGFQWDFSFELMLTHETDGTFKGCVILLDEPGLHLHPSAQEGLLSRLKEFAQENRLIYTTHLPFMIDLSHSEQIRVLEKTKDGIAITADLDENFAETRGTLRAALEIDASHGFIVAKRNLVVEGVHDCWILTELSNLLRRNGKEGLPEDIRMTPGPSASRSVHVATYMIGQDLDVVALFDSDQAGRDAEKELRTKWITGYKKSHTDTILLGDAVGADGDFEIEDLFPADFYLESVRKTYQGLGEITLQGEDMLWNQVERALKDEGIKNPNKGSVAKRLRDRLNMMKDLSELPKETMDKAINLFQAIREAFGEE